MSITSKTLAFWNAHPCDGQEALDALERYRHAKEPWLPAFLARVAAAENDVLEVGCGQGVDGLFLCRHLPANGRYVGIDLSDASIANARRYAAEVMPHLSVTPNFKVGNALDLPIESASVGAAYSMGVLHHIDATEEAIAEIYRVLRPGGRLYLGLYNSWSVKASAAHLLRRVQSILDKLSGRDRVLFRLLLKSAYGQRTGTMIHECFGVPVLKSYTANGMRRLITEFEIEFLTSCGSGTSGAEMSTANDRGTAASAKSFGYLWVVVARKPMVDALGRATPMRPDR
jgi:SAM-dependent methyltransferase